MTPVSSKLALRVISLALLRGVAEPAIVSLVDADVGARVGRGRWCVERQRHPWGEGRGEHQGVGDDDKTGERRGGSCRAEQRSLRRATLPVDYFLTCELASGWRGGCAGVGPGGEEAVVESEACPLF